MNAIIIITGSSGAGKTTHAKLLCEKIGAHYISSGDIARSMMDEETRALFHKGQLSPHEDKIRAEIYKQVRENEVVVLDGFPRLSEQWDWLTEIGDATFNIIRLDWSDKVLVNRWTERNRNEHDTLTAYALRHELFKKETEPIFAKLGYTIHGEIEKPVMEVNLLIRANVEQWLKAVMPSFKLKDSRTQQLIDKFLQDHHFQLWQKGQATTYAIEKPDIEKKLWEIVESAR